MGAFKRRRLISQAVASVGEAVAEEQTARKELKLHTVALVQDMKAKGKNKDYADGYIVGVTAGLDPATAVVARQYFETAWLEASTDE